MIHGALGARSQLAPLASLLENDFSVHILELEGHGSTPLTTAGYSVEGFANGVARYIRGERIERPVIFGYSMGGYVALKLAADDRDLVSAVMTLGTKLAWTPDVAARETARLDPGKMRAKVPKFAEALERRHGGIAGGWEAMLANTSALMTELGEAPVVDSVMLPRINQPARLMVGDRDSLVTIDETRDAVKNLPRGQLAILPDTPHPFENVRSTIVEAMIRDFVALL